MLAVLLFIMLTLMGMFVGQQPEPPPTRKVSTFQQIVLATAQDHCFESSFREGLHNNDALILSFLLSLLAGIFPCTETFLYQQCG